MKEKYYILLMLEKEFPSGYDPGLLFSVEAGLRFFCYLVFEMFYVVTIIK